MHSLLWFQCHGTGPPRDVESITSQPTFPCPPELPSLSLAQVSPLNLQDPKVLFLLTLDQSFSSLTQPLKEGEGFALIAWVSLHSCGCYRLLRLGVSLLPHREMGHIPTQGKAVSLQQS